MMKLRIRSLETKETVRVEVPPQCSLQQLKQTLSQTLSSSSRSAPAPPESIRLSLNKVDEIQSSSPEEDTLQSLGVTSGDLIFYRTVSQAPTTGDEDPVARPISVEAQDPEFNMKLETSDVVSDQNPQISPSLIEAESSKKMEIADGADSSEKMEITDGANSSEEMEIDDGEAYAVEEEMGKAFSVPGFLRKVFTEELGGDDGGRRKHKLLVIAVHAVFLESGFVGFDMETKSVVTGHSFGNILPGNTLFYSHPRTVRNGSVDGSLPYIKLMFQSLGQFLKIYGFLSSDSASTTHSVRLNGGDLVSFFNVVWANCGMNDEIVTTDGILSTTPEKEVFKFWRTVKDNLALPLLIDFCEKLGFGLPPCFMRLPTDLTLKILEHLPGTDVARVSCVSSELRYLGSSDDVWKKKYEEQFGDAKKLEHGQVSWKKRFAKSWESQKKREVNPYRVDPRYGGVNPLRQIYPSRRLWSPRRPSFPVIFYH